MALTRDQLLKKLAVEQPELADLFRKETELEMIDFEKYEINKLTPRSWLALCGLIQYSPGRTLNFKGIIFDRKAKVDWDSLVKALKLSSVTVFGLPDEVYSDTRNEGDACSGPDFVTSHYRMTNLACMKALSAGLAENFTLLNCDGFTSEKHKRDYYGNDESSRNKIIEEIEEQLKRNRTMQSMLASAQPKKMDQDEHIESGQSLITDYFKPKR